MKNKFLASICVIILYWGVVVLASSNEDLKIENSAELAENAENVCIDQKVKNQIINTTFIQTQVSFFFSLKTLKKNLLFLTPFHWSAKQKYFFCTNIRPNCTYVFIFVKMLKNITQMIYARHLYSNGVQVVMTLTHFFNR